MERYQGPHGKTERGPAGRVTSHRIRVPGYLFPGMDQGIVRRTQARLLDPRTRKRYRLARWLAGDGVEIGALFRPLPVPPRARVRYVDRMTVAQLRDHYPELSGQPLVAVDAIGSAEDLSAYPDGSLDFVIASHLMEHMQYPIRALTSFHRVLRVGGVAYLALPDARVGIDQDRDLTPLDHLLDEHRNGAEANRRRHFEDWVRYCEKNPADAAARGARLDEEDYSIHFHVWRMDTFLEFVFAAARLESLAFDLLEAVGPEYRGDDEFIVVLRKGHAGVHHDLPRNTSLKEAVRTSPLGPAIGPAYRRLKKAAPWIAPR
ncbi:MAG: hypothetical protein NVS9B1_26640 [Candidatus Dormibacteraceae bacterium]